MMKIKIIFGTLMFIQTLTFAMPQSTSTSTSSFGQPITADSKLIHNEDFVRDGDRDALVSVEKTIRLNKKIDSIRLISFNGVINVIEGGVNHNYCKVESQSYFAGAPLHTRIEIYGNGVLAKNLSMILVAVLCVVYYAV